MRAIGRPASLAALAAVLLGALIALPWEAVVDSDFARSTQVSCRP